MNVAGSLAVDSKGRLYVATIDYEVRSGGWVSVYSRGASQPTRELHMRDPAALAVDPFDNLYVANIANRSSVFVYSAGATKLLQTIDEGRDEPSALLIDAPW